MTGTVVKNALCNGYPGTPSHTPDLIISHYEVNSASIPIKPGDVCVFLDDGTVCGYDENCAATYERFGIAARTVQTPAEYADNQEVFYPGDIIGVVVRGAVTVRVNQGMPNAGVPAVGRYVYICGWETEDFPDAMIGTITTENDSYDNIEDAIFSSEVDENGICEITLLERTAV